jgi:DNA-binding NarL/FixJ family response regulator
LTGKNDKDDVMRILEGKPDGYLLKSMGHEALLDSLDRFFAGSILSAE